jgi:predicted DNA-binding transcriptional regulator YafY
MAQADRMSGESDGRPITPAVRLALLVLALARQGDAGLTREGLLALPELRALYNPAPSAAEQALRRDLIVLTGQSLREQRRTTGATEGADATDVEPEQATALARFDPATGRYHLSQPMRSLRLSAEMLETLCVVARALRGGAALPGGRELFVRLAEALGDDQRERLDLAIAGESPARTMGITLELGLRESIGELDRVMSLLWRAWRERRTVKFSYRARDKVTEHYNDEVQEIWLGEHAYTGLWCEDANDSIELRLDRIIPETLAFAPTMARGRMRRGVAIRYRLDAGIARGSVTQRLEGQTVEWQEDDAAIISGRARSLFWARKLLLGYGAGAQALEPPRLVAEMGREAERMARMYAPPEEQAVRQ